MGRRASAAVATAMVLVAAAALALALARPPRAAAAAGLQIGMEDERLLLTDTNDMEATVAAWEQAGVDEVRVQARWYANAPKARSERTPAGFHAADPDDDHYDWHRLDRAVDLIVEHHMQVLLTITGPAPWWATATPGDHSGVRRPRSLAFGRFAHAVAVRYGDRVDQYSIWNEPNQPGWLMPQNACSGRGRHKVCTSVAPHLYRNLVRAAVPEIRRADPGARILIGELAPIGQRAKDARTPTKPLPFLRTMACVDSRYRRVTTGPCAAFRPASGDGIAYHPHGRRQPPNRPNPDTNEAQIADLRRLLAVLDRLSRSGRIVAPARTGRRFDVYLTEFGFQTFPPDPGIGVTLTQQTRYLQEAAYIAWRTPRIRDLIHYQWDDERLIQRGTGSVYGGWQSGLHFADGSPKPAMGAFEAPFLADVDAGRLWGQVRTAGGPTIVTLWEQRPGGAGFTPVAEIPTDAHGYWTHPLIDLGATYRYTWPRPVEQDTAGAMAATATGSSGDLAVATTRRGLQTSAPVAPMLG